MRVPVLPGWYIGPPLPARPRPSSLSLLEASSQSPSQSPACSAVLWDLEWASTVELQEMRTFARCREEENSNDSGPMSLINLLKLLKLSFTQLTPCFFRPARDFAARSSEAGAPRGLDGPKATRSHVARVPSDLFHLT